MLVCEQCGDVYYTDTPELYEYCESCGGRLIDKTSEKTKPTTGNKKIDFKKREYAQAHAQF